MLAACGLLFLQIKLWDYLQIRLWGWPEGICKELQPELHCSFQYGFKGSGSLGYIGLL